MPENDKYPQHRHGQKTPVAILVVVLAGGLLALLAFQHDGSTVATGTAGPARLDGTVTGSTPANPNILAPPGSTGRAPTSP